MFVEEYSRWSSILHISLGMHEPLHYFHGLEKTIPEALSQQTVRCLDKSDWLRCDAILSRTNPFCGFRRTISLHETWVTLQASYLWNVFQVAADSCWWAHWSGQRTFSPLHFHMYVCMCKLQMRITVVLSLSLCILSGHSCMTWRWSTTRPCTTEEVN